MLVSAFTVQIWLDWDKVPVDVRVCTDEAHIERRDGDIIMFTPRVTELQESYKNLIDIFKPNHTFSHTTKHGTIYIKRGNPTSVVMPEVTEVNQVTLPDSRKSLTDIIKEQKEKQGKNGV